MATVSWKLNSDGVWTVKTNWSTNTVPTATDDVVLSTASAHTVTVNTGNNKAQTVTATTDTLAIAGGSLTVSGTSSLGAGATLSSGLLALQGGGSVGGTLDITGGKLALGAASLSVADLVMDGGTIAIAAGGTLSAAGTVAANGFATIDGPGALATGSALTIGSASGYSLTLGGKLAWTNAGTITDLSSIVIGASGSTDTASFVNAAAGVFNIAGDITSFENSAANGTITNQGVFAKSAGTGTSTVGTAFTNAAGGTITVASGTLALGAGGQLGGAVGGIGTLELTAGTFGMAALTSSAAATLYLNGNATVNATGTASSIGNLDEDSGTIAIANLGKITVGTGTLAAAGYATIDGPGTFATTGTMTVGSPSGYVLTLGGGLVWSNTGTVLSTGNTAIGGTDATDTASFVNVAGGTFDFTADAGNIVPNTANGTFSNAGLLEKTGGNGTSTINIALTNTGTITVAIGTLALGGGGQLGGAANGTGTLALTGGTFGLAGLTSAAATAVDISGGTVNATGTTTSIGNFDEDNGTLAIANGATVTAGGGALAVLGYSTIDGPGTFATTGSVTIGGPSGYVLTVGGGLVWSNTGTVLSTGNTNIGGTDATDTASFVNAAGGTFDFISDAGNIVPSTANGTFSNAGLLEKTGGNGTSTLGAALTNTGTITVTSGTLALSQGGQLGGTANGTGTLALTGGTFGMAGLASTAAMTVDINGAAVTATGTTTSIGNFDEDNGMLAIANGGKVTVGGGTLALAGYSTIDGPGTFATTGTVTIGGSSGYVLTVGGKLVWLNTGAVLSTTNTNIGGTDATDTASFVNAAAGTFDFISDAGNIVPSTANGTFSNAGLLEKTGGNGTSTVNAALTNSGTISVATGTIELDGATTLSGGAFGASGTGLLFLNGSTIAATGPVTLLDDGTNAGVIVAGGRTFSNTGTVTQSGILQLDNGGAITTLANRAGAVWNLATNDADITVQGTGTITNAGTIAKTGGTGLSSIAAGIGNTGVVDAASGTLQLNGTVTGAGTLAIEAASTLEMGLAVATAETVAFNGPGATLKLDAPASVTKAMVGFGAGDQIDFTGVTLTSVTLAGSTLTAKAGATSYTYSSTASLASLHARSMSDGSGGTLVTLFREAVPTAHTPEPVAFGNHHVGDATTVVVSVGNAAAADGYSEKLDASLGGASAGFTAGGSVTGIAPGATSGNALTVKLNATAAGAYSGTATLGLSSDGTNVDGFGTTALPSQTVNLSGAVYALAAPSVTPATVNLGAARVSNAGTLGGSFTVANGTSASAYQESLSYAVSAGSGFAFNKASDVVQSGSSEVVAVSLSDATSGDYTGSTATVALTSTGAGTSGLGDTALPSKTVTLNGKVYAPAVAQLSSTTLNFGVVHVGDTVQAEQTLTLTNAANGALTDTLTGGTAALSGYAGTVDMSGVGSGLAAGSSTGLVFGIDTSNSGTISGSAALGFLSHDPDLADIAINGGTVTVSGAVDNYATAQVEDVGGAGTFSGSGTNYVLNLGTVLQGGSALTADLGMLNSATGLADLLSGTFDLSGTGVGAFNNTGFASGFANLGAGQDERAQAVSLTTTNAGTYTETIVVTPEGSNSSGYAHVLPAETITVTGTVIPSGQTYTLTTGVDTINGGSGANTINAAASTLNSRDRINGGSGTTNVMNLTGTGVFDLGAPKTLTGVAVVNATEAAGKGNTVYLRDGLNLTLNVASGGSGAVTIYGGADSSAIKLGAGTDTVVLGAKTETVTTGSGTAIVQATAATAGALVVGNGAASTTLQISGGGASTLNNADSNLTVQLISASNLSLGTASFITALGSTGADTITAGGANQVLTGKAGADTLVGGTNFATIFRDVSTGLNGDLIKNFAGASLVDVTDLAFGSLKPISVTQTGSGASTVSTLHLGDGTHVAAIGFSGSFAKTDFSASADGHGGTQIALVSH